MDKMTFSYAGKSISALFSTLADVESGRSVAVVAAASAARKQVALNSATKKIGAKKPTKTEEASAQAVAGRAVDAIVAVKANDSKDKLSRLGSFNENSIPFLLDDEKNVITIPTASLIVSAGNASARRSILSSLRKQFGLEVIQKGFRGKVLMRASEDGAQGIQTIQEVLKSFPSKNDAISPNFLRVCEHRRINAGVISPLRGRKGISIPTLPWNFQNLGAVGVVGADVKALGAWTLSKGEPAIRVAVLDEGVEVRHPSLIAAIIASRDFSGNKPDSSPDGNDAHGTACAGIIASRDLNYPGLAPNVSLIGARIARSNPANPTQWIFDDFNTADAIDWCWDDANADILSNSWGGGPPSDAIRLAFERARTQGRAGKGCVIAIAAGNSQSRIPFPGTLANMLVVGASNQWDERKTKTSRDGENWWGSCFGPTLSLLAPGVKIKTTDIAGAAGYTTINFVDTFNGTSSATPQVAAASALVLSINKNLKENQVRKILTSTCDPVLGTNEEVGSGRLNLEAALEKAKKSLRETTQNLKTKTKTKTSKAAKPSSNSKPKVKAKATAEATKKAINKARHARI